MTGFFDKLNLRPLERRLIVGIGVTLFLVANVWLVWPHFKDWQVVRAQIAKARHTLQQYQAEVAKLPEYQAQEEKLKGDSGAALASEEMALALLKIVQPKAAHAGINVVGWYPQRGGAAGGEYFEEQVLRISFKDTGDQQLLNFLVSLGKDNSTIRIRDLSIKPEPTRMKLMGDVTMVASYQKAAPAPGRNGGGK